MPKRHFNNWLKAYLEYTRHLEAPDAMHFWAGVGTVAGALRGKVWFDMGHFLWKPNFFIIFVAPPGLVAKSTTIGVATGLLRQVPGIVFGPDSGTWQGINDAFIEAKQTVGMPDGSQVDMCCLTLAISELGTLLDPRNREMVDVLNDLWDGRNIPWKRRTKGEGESGIPNPWINILGCTTPGWMAENFPEYAIQGGFTSRTVFVYAEAKRHFMAYPARHMDEATKRLSPLLVEDLTRISEIAGPYEMEELAYQWGERWYGEHWQKPESESTKMAGYRSRKQTHVHKLAMVIAAARRDERVILQDDMIAADAIITALEPNMPEVFSQVSDSRDTRCAAAIVRVLRKNPRMDKYAVWRMLFSVMSWDEFQRGLMGAINAGLVREEMNGATVYLCSTERTLPQSSGTVAEHLSRSEHPSSEVAPAAAQSGGSSA